MAFETSTVRLWRTLSREDRVAAATAFWNRPTKEGTALALREIVKILRVRPQALGRVPIGQRVSAVAGLANPPEALADALLVALHVGERRSLLVDFLEAAGIPHENGVIAEDAELAPLVEESARKALAALRVRGHADPAIRAYWNALWLQDRERWAALETVAADFA
jgi:hypothetical protein